MNIGTFFHGIHTLDVTSSLAHGTDRFCAFSYLACGVVDPTCLESRDIEQCLYVLTCRTVVPMSSCRHSVYLDSFFHPPIQWTPVAFLSGWQPNQGTTGSILETSPGGTRIASAAWKRVLVWTIDPYQLYQGDLAHYYPPRDYNAAIGYGRIRPIEVPSQGVVHTMKWVDDNVLYAVTDKGLISWDLGPEASGKRWIGDSTNKMLM